MIKRDRRKIIAYYFGNNNLEYFSSYGIFFCLFFIVMFILNTSIYFYLYEEIKYLFWTTCFIFIFSMFSVCYNYFFKLRKMKNIQEFDFPSIVKEGQFATIKASLKQNVKSKDIFVMFKSDYLESCVNEDLEDLKLFYDNNNKKWGNYWSYGGDLAYNKNSLLPLDIEQMSIKDEAIRLFGRKRGIITLTEVTYYCFDLFGLFRVRRSFKLKNPMIIYIEPNIHHNYEKTIKDIQAASSKGDIYNQNIIGIKKANRGDSFKNTHWKIFAKKEEHWVFVKEKENKKDFNPLIIVDTNIQDIKTQYTLFEGLIADIYKLAKDQEINEIIFDNQYYDLKTDLEDLKKRLLTFKIKPKNEMLTCDDIPLNTKAILISVVKKDCEIYWENIRSQLALIKEIRYV